MSRLSTLLTPSVPLHELTHAVAAYPWADIDICLDGTDSRVTMDWDDDAPVWAVRLAHLAPTLVGLGIAMLLVVVFGVPSVSGLGGLALHDLGLLVILFVNWVVYVFPSYADRHPFR